MRRIRRTHPDVVRREQNGDRCKATHPNWLGVRCERQAGDHIVHTSEERTWEWVDERRFA